ncbi:conjugal transfer surface exclusion protein TraT [Oceanimonas sp. GK1]|uniref:complement resistance protein TraT n=1 Tax=Oceanimonas sp. (strain GK1 / IBRC-M 10197) TaxID=511062 RepID=UPI0002494C04|nr:complement resistance protein TraT [Oceanimonas sp. GK1]AEY00249.1 conjugal transfer surface exclusion protein TraT [Oceanimonas sp. GK1]
MKSGMKKIVGISLLASILALSGCSAMHTAIKKRDLEVKTQMSDTIWLDPVSGSAKTVYLQIRNTSDKDVQIAEKLRQNFEQKGYTVTTDANSAYYWVQMNVLKVDKMDLREANSYLSSGYGAGLTGAAAGALAAGYGYNSSGAAVAGGIVGGIIGIAADAMVEDVNYTMITDLQISEKVNGKVSVNSQGALAQGNAGRTNVSYSKESNRMRYQTRVVSTANKVNLEFEEARVALEDNLARSVGGIL